VALGNIEKRISKDGTPRYRVRVEYPADAATGQRAWRRATFPTKREAEKACREWLAEIERGVVIVPEALTVDMLLSRWLTTIQGNLREKSLHDYRYTIRKHLSPRIGRLRADRLRTADIDAFTSAMQVEGIGDRTRQVALARLKQAYGWACRTGLLSVNPTLNSQAVRVQTGERNVWSPDDWQRFAAHAGEYLPMFGIFTATGLRRGEVLGLRWRDVDLGERTISVRQTVASIGGTVKIQEQPKTESSRRTVRISESVVSLLRDHRRMQIEARLRLGPVWQDHDLVFPGPMGEPFHPDAITRILARIAAAAGVPRLTVHELRHTHTTWLVLAGVPLPVISQRIGHARVSTTMDLYAHLLKDSQDMAADVADRMVFPRSEIAAG